MIESNTVVTLSFPAAHGYASVQCQGLTEHTECSRDVAKAGDGEKVMQRAENQHF